MNHQGETHNRGENNNDTDAWWDVKYGRYDRVGHEA